MSSNIIQQPSNFPKSSYLSTKKKKKKNFKKSSCQVDHIPANILLSAPHFLLWLPMQQVYNKKSNFKIKIKIKIKKKKKERKEKRTITKLFDLNSTLTEYGNHPF